MAAHFKHTGPACCCCHDLWPFPARYKLKVAKPAVFEWIATGTPAGEGDFDHVAKKALYMNANGSGSYDVYLHDDKEDTETFVLNRTLSTVTYGHEVQGVCDPDNQRIIDVCKQTNAGEELIAHVYNYDGTGDTALFTLPALAAPDYYSKIRPMHYNRITGTVFGWLGIGSAIGGLAENPSPDPISYELIEFDLLGNPPTIIHSAPAKRYTPAADWYYQFQPPILDIDYTNQKLWWILFDLNADPGDTFVRKVQRCNWDGSNFETLEATPIILGTPTYAGLQYSHKDNCFYLMTYGSGSIASDTTNGFYRVSYDWTERELLYSRADLNTSPGWYRLGCGYETLGASSMA